MSLELLKIYNARNLIEYSVSPHPHYNIFYGVNGAGKTTILESVFLLLRSKTFRSVKYKSFINRDSNNCTVFAKFSHSHSDCETFENSFTLGISRSKDLTQPVIHLNSDRVNYLSSITNLVILGLITPQSFNLIDAGPSIRRKFIDWGVFHVEPTFLADWKAFNKIQNSRNTLLKKLQGQFRSPENIPEQQLDNLKCWSPQLIKLNNKLHNLRSRQVNNIAKIFKMYLKIFSSYLSDEIKLTYYQGWNKELTYEDYLSSKLKDDMSAGYTRYGTHRGDIRIYFDNFPAKDLLSRGQKKIIIICLIMAQFTFLIQKGNTDHSLLLLDDIDSELDQNNLEILFGILNSIPSQVLVTTTNKDKFNFLNVDNHKLFHVEH